MYEGWTVVTSRDVRIYILCCCQSFDVDRSKIEPSEGHNLITISSIWRRSFAEIKKKLLTLSTDRHDATEMFFFFKLMAMLYIIWNKPFCAFKDHGHWTDRTERNRPVISWEIICSLCSHPEKYSGITLYNPSNRLCMRKIQSWRLSLRLVIENWPNVTKSIR